ncbi:hypothetical protein LUW76_46820 [Actinomadura madurae]|uniref:hypothetical protein n=1 Tax=Actinomadura madurae TaxID=1993 RepID=UPI002026BCBA|nr:hypothetical protein [Actinomadura madurae]URN01213.1 hypothetical protein LUW76_46820 [Actinomadura madurae]
MTKISVTFEIDDTELRSCSDPYLATLWHVAQANPAPHDDKHAGEIAERIGREIVRRWLGKVEPELWRHQSRGYYHSNLCRFARYEAGGAPGAPEWDAGIWVAKADTGTSTSTSDDGSGGGR